MRIGEGGWRSLISHHSSTLHPSSVITLPPVCALTSLTELFPRPLPPPLLRPATAQQRVCSSAGLAPVLTCGGGSSHGGNMPTA